MTSARDVRESTGRGNPAGPYSLYQRLTGRPAGYDQIQRFTRIGQLLEAGPDDTAWGLIVAQEAYLVWTQENVLRTTTMIRAWCLGILASIVLSGLLAVGLAWYAGSAYVQEPVDRAFDRLSRQLAQQTDCSAVYGQAYCNSLRVVDDSVARRQIVGAIAALSDDTASILASTVDLPQALTSVTRLTSPQWEQIRRISAVGISGQKGREGR